MREAMMAPRGVWDDWEDPPYDVPRGSCPRCGSGDVEHLVIGLPGRPDDMMSGPEWVSWIGCIHPGYDRRCGDCDLTWTAGRVDDHDE